MKKFLSVVCCLAVMLSGAMAFAAPDAGPDKATFEELLAAGTYTEDTPCAVVYKVSWPEEKILRTVLSGLAEAVEREGIRKTALLLVGDFLGENHERSCLYDKEFHTEYR